MHILIKNNTSHYEIEKYSGSAGDKDISSEEQHKVDDLVNLIK